MSSQTASEAFENARDQWQICDWPAEFGPLKLRLHGVRSVQAERLSRATSGQESLQWRLAADWLRQIEEDAGAAQQLASRAVAALAALQCETAVELAEQACQREAVWHRNLIWGALRDAIRYECRTAAPSEGHAQADIRLDRQRPVGNSAHRGN